MSDSEKVPPKTENRPLELCHLFEQHIEGYSINEIELAQKLVMTGLMERKVLAMPLRK